MPATTRPADGLAALTAGLTLMAGLTLTACDTTTTATPDATTTTTPDATAQPCRTAALTWTLSLLDGDSAGNGDGRGDDRSGARLTAVNKGSGACLFAGYPGLEIHNGKADGIEGAGAGRPSPVALPGHAAVTVDLRYTRRGTPGAGTWCVRQHEAAVTAPHDTVVPVTDAHGKAAVLDACGETIAMAPPRRAGAGT
ncbi:MULTISPECIES: DUF4232 domain-containing protein [Streptomyces]|uniref:DUF4232 domain-containing protein n=1 Tax=Streptomyces TaxID=1883 RepID=UPI001679431E|nr:MULTISPECIES: DUF4232 domain-containing protein [Streptomyces]MBK3520164.1 DUF4232 domain-containing protein [Streptomyces sp. MBT70]GGR73869.1 hypothetical protein GCM10010236_30440 [Streptomyces eurythermus]